MGAPMTISCPSKMEKLSMRHARTQLNRIGFLAKATMTCLNMNVSGKSANSSTNTFHRKQLDTADHAHESHQLSAATLVVCRLRVGVWATHPHSIFCAVYW